MATKKCIAQGRPKTGVNAVRQVGRWDDDSWELVKSAAYRQGLSVAAWARQQLLRAARRELK